MDAAEAQNAFQKQEFRDSVQTQAMWGGGLTLSDISGLIGMFVSPGQPGPDGQPTEEYHLLDIKNQHTEVVLKSVDEYLVNASDHAKSCARRPARGKKWAKVTTIALTFHPDGLIEVFNDGPGIPVVVHAEISAAEGRTVWVPEISFCHFLSGTNFSKSPDSVTGGLHGIGAKLGNVHSSKFRVNTVWADAKELYHYTQTCENRMQVIHPPQITRAAEWPAGTPPPTPHTLVTFRLAWAELGYTVGGPLWATQYTELAAWMRLRCNQIAAYLGGDVSVSFNGAPARAATPVDLARLYLSRIPGAAGAAVFQTTIKPKVEPYKNHPWEIVAIVSPAIRKFTHHAILNGVVTNAGPHVKHLKALFLEQILKQFKKLVKDVSYAATATEACKHMLLVVVGALPGASWTGQCKDTLTASKETMANFQLPAKWSQNVGEAVAHAILEATGKKKTVKKSAGRPEKYTPAKLAGKGPCWLAVTEGDSADTLMRAGFTLGPENPGGPSFVDHGTFTLGGVPMNGAKQINEVGTAAEGGEGEGTITFRKKVLENNKVLADFRQILNLDWNCDYSTDAQMRTLRYSGVIFCFDGDVDGSGKIAGIMLMNFYTFWPNLIRRGYIKWFMTPLVRVYPRGAVTAKQREACGAVKEFYLEQAFEDWAADPAGGGGLVAVNKRYHVNYYKGLGSHDVHEIPGMFRNFTKNLYTFVLDDAAPELFDVYFGKDTGPRKDELSSPLQRMTPEIMRFIQETRQVPCSLHLTHFVKPYKLDATERQIPGALDSLNTARRKALAAARRRFRNRAGECQTFQLAGYVADIMSYHHGGPSMEDAIVRMCQRFRGARLMPFLIGIGAFGTTIKGGKDAASPRYTKVALNYPLTNALFPPADDQILPYVFVDGIRAEPKSFIPVICCTVLDNSNTVSEGWNYRCWGRCPSQVIAITAAYCDPEHPGHALVQAAVHPELAGGASYEEVFARFQAAFPLTPAIGGEDARHLRVVRGKLHHFGTCDVKIAPGDPAGERGATVVITSLPICTWSATLAEKLLKKPKEGKTAKSDLILDIEDHSGKSQVNIAVKLKPGALAKIERQYNKIPGVTPLESFFELYTSFTSQLNVIRPSADGYGGIMMFGENYHALVAHHLPIRRRYYEKRFLRSLVLLELEIAAERAIVRFIDVASEVQLSKTADEAAANQVLAARGFPRINLARIRAPGYLNIDELRALIQPAAAAPAGPPAQLAPEDGEAEDGEAKDGEAKDGEAPGHATYNYILNLRERDLIESARLRRLDRIEQLERDHVEIEAILAEKPFPAASVWRAELAQVERVLRAQDLYL